MQNTNWHLYEWLLDWLNVYAKQKIKQKTYESYLFVINLFIAQNNNKLLSKVDNHDCQLYLNKMYDKGLSKSTIHSAKVVLAQALESAKNNGYINLNPARDIIVPVHAPTKQIYALTKEQQAEVISACYGDKYGVITVFLLYTGLRATELCELKWKNYNKKEHTIHIEKSKTANGIRKIPLLPICVQIIETRPKRSEYIFSQDNGNQITRQVLKKTYLRMRQATGISCLTNHVYRHTFATRLVEQGAHPKSVMELMGHSNLSFTMNRYTHANIDYLREQISLLSIN